MAAIKRSAQRHTLAELMALVALCAVAFALLLTPSAFLGVGILVVLPGFVVDRLRGGTGIKGSIASGCLIPLVLTSLWAVIEFVFGRKTFEESVSVFSALYLIFVVCLVWSTLLGSLLYLLDRRLQGPRSRISTGGHVGSDGIRFLSDE